MKRLGQLEPHGALTRFEPEMSAHVLRDAQCIAGELGMARDGAKERRQGEVGSDEPTWRARRRVLALHSNALHLLDERDLVRHCAEVRAAIEGVDTVHVTE